MFLQNKCMFYFHRPSSLVCRTIWYFHQEEWLLHQQLLETVSIVLIIHCQEFLVIRSVKHCYPRAVPTGALTQISGFCREFSLYCLNRGMQVFQIISALPAKDAICTPPFSSHQAQQSCWTIVKGSIIGHAVSWYLPAWLEKQTMCPGNIKVSLHPLYPLPNSNTEGDWRRKEIIMKSWAVQKGYFLSSPRFSMWISAETRRNISELGTWMKMFLSLPKEPVKNKGQG